MDISEENTRQAWQASPLAIVTIDERDHIRFVNPAGLRIFGRTESDLVGVQITELAHSLDKLALNRMLESARSGGTPPRQEVRFTRLDQSEIVTGFSVAPTSEGECMSVCVLRDLSSELAYRPQMLHTERMASMGLVASVVAHELNNALAGASGCLELLRSEVSPAHEDLVVHALRELHRSAEIVSDLKGYARVDDELADSVEVADLLSNLVRLHRYHQSGEAVSDIDIHIPVKISALRGNKNQLLQALLNLIRNAEDAVADLSWERRQLSVQISEVSDVVCLAVVDRGPGVPEKLRARLFDPFYSTKAVGAGTGLGLSVVQAVAAGHGGRVEVDETPGGGATFRMLIPKNSGFKKEPETSAVAVSQAGALVGLRVLIADDESTMCSVLDRACKKYGATTTVVGDAQAAIDLIEREDFDIYLLDVRMPGGGGPAVFRFLKERRKTVSRTIFISGELSSEMNEIVGGGYAGILKKPFKIAQLVSMLCLASGRDLKK